MATLFKMVREAQYCLKINQGTVRVKGESEGYIEFAECPMGAGQPSDKCKDIGLDRADPIKHLTSKCIDGDITEEEFER